jgi:hypothetical protein
MEDRGEGGDGDMRVDDVDTAHGSYLTDYMCHISLLDCVIVKIGQEVEG